MAIDSSLGFLKGACLAVSLTSLAIRYKTNNTRRYRQKLV